MKKIIITLLAIMLISCSNNVNEKKVIEKTLQNILTEESFTKYKYCIVIPNSGCDGCITNAENFVKDNAELSNTLFLFTRVVSEKLLKLKVTPKIFNNENIIIDDKDRFNFLGDNSIYPMIIYLDNHQNVDSYEFVSPKNPNAISKLLNNIKSLNL